MQPVELRKLVGANIRARRQQMGLNQRQLAAVAGTAQAVISEMENGKLAFSIDTLANLADALKIPPHFLFEADYATAAVA